MWVGFGERLASPVDSGLWNYLVAASRAARMACTGGSIPVIKRTCSAACHSSMECPRTTGPNQDAAKGVGHGA